MDRKKLFTLSIVGAVALLSLVILQVYWVAHAHAVHEEQFNDRVSMAMCSAVDRISNDTGVCRIIRGSITPENLDNNQVRISDATAAKKFDAMLKQTLKNHNIELDYKYMIVNPDAGQAGKSASSLHTCSMQPITNSQGSVLQVIFPGKTSFILGQMSFMLISSGALIVLLTMIFIVAIRTIWKQRKIAEMNVEFFNNMAHEFRTPLTNIALANSMQRRNHEGDSRYVNIIQDENTRLITQVEQVLNVAKLEKGEYQFDPEPISLNTIVEEACDPLLLRVKAEDGTMRLNLDKKSLNVDADHLHMVNVVGNLIDNAIKYSNDKPEITVRTFATSKYAIVAVTDKGIGMSKDKVKEVFKKFYRISSGDVYSSKGFGLGLSYAKMVVEAHKGQIKVASEEGEGSTFEILIPLANNQSTH